jgi:gliding motility-associated-like protein
MKNFTIVLLFFIGIFVVPLTAISQNDCITCGLGTSINRGNPQSFAGNAIFNAVENGPHKIVPTIINSLNTNPTVGLLNVCGLNWTEANVMTQTRSTIANVNTNGTGFPTTLSIAGIPATCYQIEAAYLYYTASYTEAAAPITTASFTNPALVNSVLASTLVATGPSVGWGETGTAEYRVDVTANISGNGTYTVNLNGFANAAWEVDGCTLIIVYIAGPTNSTTATFALWDGDWVQNSSNTTYDDIMTFPAPCTNTTAQAFVQISDDQANVVANHTDIFNAITSTFPNNFYSFDEVNVALTTASTSITAEPYSNWVQGSSYDLWEWTLVGMYWQNIGCTNCLPQIAMSDIEPPCNGGTGTATATVTDGTPPYTYTWSNGQTTSSVNGLTTGTYTINVEDVICNTAQATVTITQPPLLTASTVMTQATCGNTNGTATVTAGGGTLPYTYLWTPTNQTNATATGLSAGTYTATVTDNNGCIVTSTIIVTNSGGITPTMGPQTNILCNGGTASATVSVVGGTGPYTYAWVPNGGSNATGTGLTAGSYTVNVTDANGCTALATIIITEPTAIVPTISASANVLCNGGSTGSATVSAVGGTGPYTYAWTPSGGSLATATGLSAATYTVTVTDANGCDETTSVIIGQPAAITLVTGATQTTCGGNTGTTTVTANGGTPAYTYLWTPSNNSNATATGLTAGVYTITVTDANGCTQTSAAVVTTTGGLTVTTSTTGISCFGGSDGTATAIPSNGTAPYTYAWLPSGGTNVTATGLSLGTYTVSVTDANGCLGTATATITQPTAVTASCTATQTACSSNTGTTTVTPGGGTPGYDYVWNPSGITTATATGLSAGIYTVTVTDANGCTQTSTATVTSLNGETVSISAFTNITCNGANNGSITSSVVGGTAPYVYAWTPTGGTNASATGLSAATYTVTVTDANGCIAIASQTITEPTLLTAAITSTANISCPGPNTGTLVMAAGGGTPGYTYNWAPSGGTLPTASGLSAGTYTVTVTDANGCTATASGTIMVITANPLLVAVSGSASFCPGGSATLTVNASGGSGNYTFLWSPGNSTLQSITVTPASTITYTVTVTDGCGDVVSEDATVTVNSSPTVSFKTDPTIGCAPLCIQFRDLSTITSDRIVQWKWNFGDGDSSSERDPIHCYQKTGSYNVTLSVTSDSGCSSTLQILNMINVYASPVANFTYSPQPVTIIYPVVQFTDISSSPDEIVYWNWRFGDGADSTSTERNPTHTYSDTGTYCATLTVMDEHGCVDSITNCLVVDPVFTLYIPDAFTPNGDGLNDVFMAKGSYIKDFEMYVFDRWGMKLFHSNDIMNGWNGTVNNGTTISQEDTYVYLINVTDAQGNKHSYNGKVTLLK